MTVYDFSARDIRGNDVSLKQYQGKVLVIVNVASECGYTPQYTGLQLLRDRYGNEGLEVLGFPCNQFGGQEPGDEAAIGAFCEAKFRIKFPLFSKIEVNGKNTHPLYEYLKNEKPGLLGTKAIKWNFTKFLIGRDGNPVARYGSTTKPDALAAPIEKLLRR